MQRDGLGYMFYLYFNSLTFALQENGPFSKSCEVAAFPAAASRDEIEQLRVQAAAAVRSYREARAAAATKAIYQAARRKPEPETIYQAIAQGGSTADDVAETGSADDVALVAGPTPSLGAPSVPIVETAAIGACRETRAAARRKAINQAAVAPSADAHSGLTADCPSADLSLIFKSALQKSLKRMAARGIQPFALYSNHEQLKRQADKAWNVGRVAPRKPKNIIAASYNIPMCGVKYPNPRRNPLKRRKLE